MAMDNRIMVEALESNKAYSGLKSMAAATPR